MRAITGNLYELGKHGTEYVRYHIQAALQQAHSRVPSGDQERQLADKLENWISKSTSNPRLWPQSFS